MVLTLTDYYPIDIHYILTVKKANCRYIINLHTELLRVAKFANLRIVFSICYIKGLAYAPYCIKWKYFYIIQYQGGMSARALGRIVLHNN